MTACSPPPVAPRAVVAVVGQDFPIPPAAGTPRPFHLLRGLAQRVPVHLLGVVRPPRAAFEAFAARPELSRLLASVVAIEREQPRLSGAVRTWLAGEPSLSQRWKAPAAIAAAHRAARDLASRHGPLAFYCWGLAALQFVPRELWGALVLDCVDAVSLSAERRLQTDRALAWRERLRLSIELALLRRYEAKVLPRVAAVTLNSSADLSWLRARVPGAPLLRVIDGGDAEYFAPGPFAALPEGDDEVVFVGNMSYPPNADAARFLASEILPRVRARVPRARAVLIGPDPGDALALVRGLPGVTVTGFVDDVRPYLRRAALAVSPLRFGAGMKNKLQAGLAMEKAMVVSSLTCEGFDELVPGRDALIADDAESFAARIAELLADPARRRALGAHGRALIRDHYSWDAAHASLWQAIARCRPV
jgi:glycosyltransferase involved in cell wall biosynthesis